MMINSLKERVEVAAAMVDTYSEFVVMLYNCDINDVLCSLFI